MFYFCCDKNRRLAVLDSDQNGIDFLEVKDDPNDPVDDRQRTLYVYFLKEINVPGDVILTKNNFEILGGERITGLDVIDVSIGVEPNLLQVEVDQAGDFSIYTLQVVSSQNGSSPPSGIDPMLANIDFSFKVECPSDFDCLPRQVCPPVQSEPPEINYLAKDYASFRRLMLDRMALLMPDWKERNAADFGVALIELLAYAGDHLTYQLDAVATEAYLSTARKRVSVRRHARLMDYFMHDGCNARTWVFIQTDSNINQIDLKKNIIVDGKTMPTKFITRVPGYEVRLNPDTLEYKSVLQTNPTVFELMEDKSLYADHNEMRFYTWSDNQCCLPTGALQATLSGHHSALKPGDVILFEEIKGPLTGKTSDADPGKRHVVRLVKVETSTDPVTNQEITLLVWDVEDALPFPLCISSRTDSDHGRQLVENISIARGNMVLCDHGMSIGEEPLGVVPHPHLFYSQEQSGERCETPAPTPFTPRFRPKLSYAPLTQSASYDANASAASALHWPFDEIRPEIRLTGSLKSNIETWTHPERRDLLYSLSTDTHFLAEVENDGSTFIRFGDDEHGVRPLSGTTFSASYRVGNGSAGNIGAGTLFHIVTNQDGIKGITNPFAARGGSDPETMEQVRQRAPFAFRTQERAVTEQDYAEMTERQHGIQKAMATLRWTGSWHTVFITADRQLGLKIDNDFKRNTRRFLEPYRMAGHDIEIDKPRYVPLEIEMQICIKPEYFRSDVKKELADVFSNRMLPDGRLGYFHPDNFSFGQTVYLSPLYAAAQNVRGVESVSINKFKRLGENSDPLPIIEGKLNLHRLEIARLDNDRNFPDRGVLTFELKGGK